MRKYVGITDNLQRRLQEHNSGKSIHTNKLRPWKVMTYIAFNTSLKAEMFERYLKSHSGRAFATNHF
jgi:putative endonuclease